MDKVEIKEYQNLSEPVRVTVVTGLLNMEGVRVPAGGKEGQNLTKKSDKAYDVYWADPDDINSIEHITLNGEEVPVENKTAKITVDKATVGLENIYAELNENIIKNPEKTYLAYQGDVFNTAKSTNFQPAEGVVIDWGDGTTFVCTGTDAPITHNYTDGINCHLISISGATSIGYYWFADYAGILSAALGNTITVIDRGAFAYCSNLIQITIPETVNTILGHAFERSGLRNVIIPKSVTEIGAYAFSQTALRTVVILGNITSLGDNAFSLNSDLTDISIYGNIDLLAGGCFRQNTRLKNLCIYGNIGVCEEGSDFTACYDLSTVTFRGNVEEVPSFSIGKKLREVKFLGTVKTIPGGVFGECPKLQILYFSDKTPAKIGKSSYTDNIFTYTEKIVVPKDAIDTYKSAAGWSTYADKIVYEVDSSDIDKAITDLDVDNIAYKNKRNTFTQQMYIRNNNPYLTLGPNSQDEGNLGKDSLTFDYASGTKQVTTIYNRDYLYHYYYDSSTGEDIEANLRFPTKSGTLALIEDLTAKLDKPTVADSNYKIVTYNGTNSGTLDYSTAPSASSVMQRDADGRAQVVNGVSGNDIVNYSQLETKYDKTGGTIGGNVVITGDLTVNGTQHINNTENLNVENAMIYSNANGATLATNGGIGIKKNTTDVYGIVYDPTSDSVKLGIGKSDANGRFTFNANEGQPVAIRDDRSKFTNNNLVKWDSESYKFVDAGKNVDSFVDKLPDLLRSQAYVRNANGEDSGLAYTYTDEGNTLALRNASGQVQVSTPLQDNDAANKKFVEDNFVKARKVSGDGFILYGASASNPNDAVEMALTEIPYTVPRRVAGGQIFVGTPTEESHATTKKYVDDSSVTTPITETETVVVDTTTVNFALDAEHDTGMYVSAENAISLSSTQLQWDDGRQKYKVIWDGVEYICYGQSTTNPKYKEDGTYTYYDWQILGNGNNKLNCYNKDTNIYPFAITQDRWKNSAEWLIYATTSTAATHTIKVIKVEGTYKKVTPEYQYDYLSMLKNGRSNNTLIHGFSVDDDGMSSGILSGNGNQYINDVPVGDKYDTGVVIFGNGNLVHRYKATGNVLGVTITGYGNALHLKGADCLSPFIAGYKNTITANKGTIHPDAVFGSHNKLTYDGNTTYGLNLVGGNSHTIKNAALSLITGLGNTVECLEADKYIGSNIVGGQLNTVNHSRVIIGGGGNTSDRNNQFIAGTYSAANEKALVKIGNGTKDARANAFEVLDDNRAKVFGTPTENNDVLRYQDTAVEVETSLMGA